MGGTQGSMPAPSASQVGNGVLGFMLNPLLLGLSLALSELQVLGNANVEN